jgi:hypothetical protein
MSTVVAGRLAAVLQELKHATDARHRLRRASPEYQAALEREVRLAAEVRRLIEADRAEGTAD